jgi:hypothetical protein
MLEEQQDKTGRDRLYDSLFLSAKALKIIPENFDRQQFRERFFYFFIELNHKYKDKPFNEHTFDNENGYSIAMLRAFDFMFLALLQKQPLTFQLLDQIHEKAVSGAYTIVGELQDEKERNNMTKAGYIVEDQTIKMPIQNSWRALEGPSFSITPQCTSKEFLQQIKADKFRFKTALLGEDSLIKYTAVRGNHVPILQIYRTVFAAKYGDSFVEKSIAEFNKRLATIDPADADKKIQLIGDLVGDLDNFHLYGDGNGRTHDFLLVSYLLIGAGLAPCMVFQPWHYCALTSEQRIIVIKDGQEAYRQYFLAGKTITAQAFAQPITAELQAITISVSDDEIKIINQAILNLAENYLKITLAKQYSIDLQLVEKARQKLGEALGILEKHKKILDDISVFCLTKFYAEICDYVAGKLKESGYNINRDLVAEQLEPILLRDFNRQIEDMSYKPTFGSVVDFTGSQDCQVVLGNVVASAVNPPEANKPEISAQAEMVAK